MSVKQFLSAAGYRRVDRGRDRCRDLWRADARLKRLLALVALTAMFTLIAMSPAEAVTYGGSATGAQVTISATNTTIRAATGTLSISGGGTEAALLVGDIPGSATGGVVSLAAGTMHSSIVGLDAARAEASTANVTLTISNNQITSDFIMARGTASCGPAGSGDSTLINLVINGQAITVTGSPNQMVTLPNGTAVINKQTSSIVGTSAAINVYALDVTTVDPITGQPTAEAVVAAAQPQIDCQAGTPPTGGFGFDDRSVPFSMQSTSITSIDNSVPCQTTINGTFNNGGAPDTFTVTIRDNGEPGAGIDTINLNATGVYMNANSTLVGGNIQSHPSCR
jgi:hypothetical protein